MRVLAMSYDNPNISWDGKEEVLRKEAEFVWRLNQRDIIRDIWFTEPNKDAVLILECDSLNQAKEIINEFPLVKDGLISFNILQIIPYDGFERLFAKLG